MQSFVNGRALRHWLVTVASLEIAAAVLGLPGTAFALAPLIVTAVVFGVRAVGDAWASGAVLRAVTAQSEYAVASHEYTEARLTENGVAKLATTLDTAGAHACDLVLDAVKRRDRGDTTEGALDGEVP